MNPRTTRQGRLANVGPLGNSLLEAAHVQLQARGAATEYERSYLLRAGVGAVLEPACPSTEAMPPTTAEKDNGRPELHPAAAALWEGADAALSSICQVLSLR